MSQAAPREQRFVFGEVAEDYDAVRPGYPDALLDDVAAMVRSGARALEIGAGTGKATASLVERGLSVLALEPSGPMATVARRRLTGHHDVRVEETTFEDWPAERGTFDLVVAAQSWHWVRDGEAKAADCLRAGGVLALFWNRPVRGAGPPHDGIEDAYRAHYPREGSHHVEPDPTQRLEASGRFDRVTQRSYPWSRTYSTAEYLRLATTHSDHRMLGEEQRDRLLQAIGAAVDAAGGTVTIEYVCRLYTTPVSRTSGSSPS